MFLRTAVLVVMAGFALACAIAIARREEETARRCYAALAVAGTFALAMLDAIALAGS